MMRIIFRNMETSELARDIVNERMQPIFERFDRLLPSDVVVTLKMDNSPEQAGPDLFWVKFHCTRGPYRGIILEKSSSNLYAGLADVVDGLLERLARHADRKRSGSISAQRRLRDQATRELDAPPASATNG
jgi:ribosome-associated translation inhibitor RaiA